MPGTLPDAAYFRTHPRWDGRYVAYGPFDQMFRTKFFDQHPEWRTVDCDGTPVRDYLHVDDAVSAYLMLAEQLEREDVCGGAFNFGANNPISALELVRRILDVCGAAHLAPDIRGVGKLTNEIDEQYLDSRKAARVLGWVPTVSLEDGLRRTVEWYQGILTRPAAVGVK